MATAKRRGEGGDKGGNGDGERQGPSKRHGGDPVRIHEEYVQHHLSGSEPMTPEAYERAMENFRRLPGAVRAPATEVRPRRGKSKPDDDEPQPSEDRPGTSPERR